MTSDRPETPEEEKANTWTHAIGIVMSIVAFFILLKAEKIGNQNTILAIGLFGFGMLATYVSSTFYHAETNPKRKQILQICDHISIFLMVGGSYSPFVQLYIEHDLATFFMSAMWSIIAVGIVLKIFFTGKYDWISILLYVFLGWMVLFIYKPMTAAVPTDIFSWIFYGGLSYTIGILFYIWRKLKYSHAIWHVFVLFGTFCHILALYWSLVK